MNKIQEKVRLYIGTVIATSPSGEHPACPFAILTPSIQVAADEARKHAFSEWPLGQGFTDHTAYIAPIDCPLYELLADAALRGILDISPVTETPSEFRFKPGTDLFEQVDWSEITEQ